MTAPVSPLKELTTFLVSASVPDSSGNVIVTLVGPSGICQLCVVPNKSPS